MLKRSVVKRATREVRGGSGIAHTEPQVAHRSSIASVVGRTGRTMREAQRGHSRHSDCDGLWARDIGEAIFSCLGASRRHSTASRSDCQREDRR